MGYNKRSEFEFILFHFLTSLFLWKNPGTVWSTAPGFFHAARRRANAFWTGVYHRACSVSFPLCHPRGTASPAWVGRRSVYGQHLFLGSIQHLHFIHHELYIVPFETLRKNVYSQCIFAYFFGIQPFLCIYVRTSLFFFAILLITIIDVQSERGYNSFINLPSPVTWETRKGE